MNKMKKRILALILSITLVFSQNMLAMAEDPTTEETPAEEPAAEETPAEEPAPVAEEPAPIAEEPVVEEPVVEEPVIEEPVVEEPVVEEPVVEEPVVEEPAEEEIVEEEIFEEPEVAAFEEGSVKIHAVKGTFNVPSKDVTMTVKVVDGDREMVIAEALTAKLNEEGKEMVDFIVYDIDLWTVDENEEEHKAELALPVEVAIENTGLVADETAEVIGFQIGADNSVELMSAELNEEGKAVLEPEHFTETGVIVAANKPAITVYDYKSSEVNVLVTLTNPEDLPDAAELVVTPLELTSDLEVGIGEAAREDGIILKEIHAFDIKFMLDGEEVQPGNTVNVTISLPGMNMADDTAVYHVDGDDIENMDGEVNASGDVEFETPHFSVYAVVPTATNGDGDINGYGTLGGLITSGNIEYGKNAKVDNWDERTYDITIAAKATVTEENEFQRMADGMMVVDMSGSMLWTLTGDTYKSGYQSHNRLGYFKDVKDNLDKTKFYYVQNFGTSDSWIEYMSEGYLDGGHDKTSRVMAYFDHTDDTADGWYYYDVRYTNTIPEKGTTYQPEKWTKMADNSNFTVYDFDEVRLTLLKDMVLDYMGSIAANSPGSYLGMTTFYSEGYNVLDYAPIAENGKVKLDVVQKFAALRPQREWCTHPDEGLELAFKEMVSANSTYNADTGVVTVGSLNASFTRKVDGKDTPKYVILFSDGIPDAATNDDYYIPRIEKATLAWAKAFRDSGVTVYTVAFAYNNSDSTWLTDIASPGCTYKADTLDQLKNVLTNIKDKETITLDYVDVDVYDYIDPRFVILDDNGTPIGVDYPGIADGITVTTIGYDGETAVTRTGKVHYDAEGRQYIIWDNTKAMKEGSTWTVKVQAREDYIGGNDVTTNIDQLSRIEAGEHGTLDLPDPKVNVKATMEIGNDNVIIYKGTQTPTAHAAETDPLTMLYNAEAAVAAYLAPGYAGVDAEDFALTWYADAECTEELTLEEIAEAILSEETNYYLKLTYNPGAASEDSNANTTKAGTLYISGRDDGNDDGIVEATNTTLVDENQAPVNYGVYNVKLWQIVKYNNDREPAPLAGAEFTLTAEDGTVYYCKSDETGFVALYEDSEYTTPAAATPIGTFTFAETVAPEGYQLSKETWELTTSLKSEESLANGVDSIESSTNEEILKEEEPEGVVASYIFVNEFILIDLPETGGIGTAMFTRAGFALLLGAAWLTCVSCKAKREEEN